MDRKFDIVVYGATSFVGEIIAAHMMRQHGGDGSVHWAIAGRSEEKLVALKEKIGAEEIPHIVADSDDEKSLVDLAKQTKVVLTTVGPYALYGELLLKVCAETGTDYCDLTGEVQWYRKMLLKYEDQAKQSGARIMPCSGFDSMPSDLGVYFLQKQAKKRFRDRCHRVKARVEKIRGGASGGSAMSFLNVAKEMAQDPVVKKEMHNPYALCPKGHNYTVVQNEIDYAEFDDDFDSWIGTFMMSKVNTRIVHRSNALMDDVYGADFTYDEAMPVKSITRTVADFRVQDVFHVLPVLANQ